MILKEYQKKAVDKLFSNTIQILNNGSDQTKSLVFKAPTGSGKTVMMQEFLKQLADTPLSSEFSFLRISVNDLSNQSKKSFERNLEGSKLIFSVLSDIADKELKQHEILFINWESIRSVSKETGERKVLAMKDNERKENLPTYLRNTHLANRKIILIVDESHKSLDTPKAQELILNYIKPTVQIEVSATPDSKAYETKIEVDIDEVIREGMIKKEILINENVGEFVIDDKLNTLDSSEENGLATDEIILQKAFEKQAELEKLYAEAGSNMQPLVLIQLLSEAQKTSEIDQTKIERVKKILTDTYDITLENKKLAIRLSEDKTNKDLIDLEDSPVKALIFKQAIATGRDCPRAQILVMFREIKTITFEIQTVGRILRMPEWKHYDNEILNKAYVFTDLPKESMGISQTAKNLIKNQISYIKPDVSDEVSTITLPSFYQSRVDYKDIGASFKLVLAQQMIQKVNGNLDDLNSENNKTKLATFINLDPKPLEIEIMTDGTMAFGSQATFLAEGNNRKTLVSIDDYTGEQIFAEESVKVKNQEEYVQVMFENFARNQVGPQFTNIARSYKPIIEALYAVLDRYFFGQQSTRTYYQTLILSNKDFFLPLLTQAKDAYLPIRQKEFSEKTQTSKKNPMRKLPRSQGFSEDTSVCNYKKYVFQPCFVSLDSEQEKLFIENYLERSNLVKFRYKNGVNSEEYFAIRYFDKDTKERAFYPDFIVFFRDGTIGIFDPKGGFTLDEAQPKAQALENYINTQRQNGTKIVGGLIKVKSKGRDVNFFINNKGKFDPSNQNDFDYFSDEWVNSQ